MPATTRTLHAPSEIRHPPGRTSANGTATPEAIAATNPMVFA
jgi:hypothetical protein